MSVTTVLLKRFENEYAPFALTKSRECSKFNTIEDDKLSKLKAAHLSTILTHKRVASSASLFVERRVSAHLYVYV